MLARVFPLELCIEYLLLRSSTLTKSSNLFLFPITDIFAPEVSKFAEQLLTTCSCIIRTIEPHVTANEDDLKTIVAKVTEMERQGNIATWNEQNLPDAIVKQLPTPG